MSRYVDLDGLTWDGNKISSKIQEVKTKHGYMQGITVGWLWGDNVPHIDLEEHDAKVRAEAIDEFRKKINNYLNESTDFADFVVTDSAIDRVLDEMKGAEE